MKKSVKVVLGIAAILITVAVVVFAFLFQTKDAVSLSEFKMEAIEKHYDVINVKEQYSAYDFILSADIAVSKNREYQIEFYVLSDEQHAKEFFLTNKAQLESYKGNVSSNFEKNFKNGNKFAMSSNQQYMVVSRIDNTVIYLRVDEKYKDEVKDFLDEIDY